MAEIVSRSAADLRYIGQSDVILTGATGFVGQWLSMSYLRARQELALAGKLYAVARNPSQFEKDVRKAGLADGLVIIQGDVRTLSAEGLPHGASIVHAATPARASLNSRQPLEMIDIIVRGQNNMLGLARSTNASRFLFLSSGAVYGRQPHSVAKIPESWEGAPLVGDPANAYHEAKRLAEMLGNITCSTGGVSFTSARLFAFLAPFLPLDEHFAAGNFLGNASRGEPISISSGGGSIRTYQYGTDMSVWLWAMLARGRPLVSYNVGSDQQVSIKTLAELVARQAGSKTEVKINGVDTDANVSRYVPDVSLARDELGVSNMVDLAEAIQRTLEWVTET
jgi:dTDP-glucose 4,6-dehydratase